MIKQNKVKPTTVLKVTLLHGCCSRFLNCTNVTKSRKTFHVYDLLKVILALNSGRIG